MEVANEIFVVQGVPVKGYEALRHHFMVNFPNRTITILLDAQVEQETKLHWLAQPAVIEMLA